MSHYIKGQGRHQVTLLPEVLDDFVTEDNPVRVVDVFVDGLQLDVLGFENVNAKQTGRPAYHPATMLKLYIYGYLNRIQSSRRLRKVIYLAIQSASKKWSMPIQNWRLAMSRFIIEFGDRLNSHI